MSVLLNLSTLALRELIGGTCKHCGVGPASESVQKVVGFLRNHFRDHSDRLTKALRGANQRAWQTLELALAGDSFWERCKSLVASGEEKRFKQEMQGHLQQLKLPDGDTERFRKLCLSELRDARKKGLFDSDDLNPEALADGAGGFARYGDPNDLLEAERQVLGRISDTIRQAQHAHLAQLIDLQPRPDTSLITVTVRYFFRRAIEDDPKLFQGLAFAQLEQLQRGQVEQFAAIQELFTGQGEKLEGLLDQLQADLFATFNAVLDVREEQKRIGGQNEDIYKAVIQLQGRLDLMQTELRPRHSFSIRSDAERELVKELVARYRSLPEEKRKDMPALLNAVGKLQVAAGDFQAAEKNFAAVATLVDDTGAQAEAHFNAHRAALERRDWDAALRELREAVRLDAGRFEPFPFRKYRPERILGAGGFGVAYLCRHQHLGTSVVVKTLTADELARSVTDVFAEAAALRRLEHPAIIRLGDCDFADPTCKRPYLEMDYFESISLEDHVRQHGCLSEDDLTDVGKQIAEGLQAAHRRGVLHRDVKPGNLLVRRQGKRWQVKLIDFGLAMGTDHLQASGGSGTLRASSIAGTVDYAAPEQMGRLPGIQITEASDVYGFARTCFYALFATPYPKAKHFDRLSPTWKTLLDDSVSEEPSERPATFDDVLRRLSDAGAVMAQPVAQPTPPPTVPPTTPPAGSPGWAAWSRLTSSVMSAFSPGAGVPAPPKKPPAPVLDVIPLPPPTSAGIEIVDDGTVDAIPVPKPKPPSHRRDSKR